MRRCNLTKIQRRMYGLFKLELAGQRAVVDKLLEGFPDWCRQRIMQSRGEVPTGERKD